LFIGSAETTVDHSGIRGMRRIISLYTLLFIFSILMNLAVPPALAAPPTRSGLNMLSEIRDAEPEVHARMTAAAAAVINTEAILWRTVHVSDKRVATLSPNTKAALKSARTIALEVADLSPKAMEGATLKATHLFLYTDDQQLDRVLTPEQFKKVSAKLAKGGFPAPLVKQLKPWFVVLSLALGDCEQARQGAGLPARRRQTRHRRGRA
jgi:uncharacterized protein